MFLLRANLNHEFSADCTAKFWSVFQAFSNEKIKCLKALQD